MLGGLLPAAALQLSAMAIYNTTNDLCFMIANGMSVAIATRCALYGSMTCCQCSTA